MTPEVHVTPTPVRRFRDPGSEVLARELAAMGRWDDLVGFYVERAETALDPRERGRDLLRASAVFEAQLGDSERAYLTAVAAYAEDFTSDEAARELERLGSSLGRFRDMVGEHEGLVATTTSPVQRIALLVRLARWHESFLDDPGAAEARLQAALALDPTSLLAARTLADLYGRQGDWARAVHHLVRAAGGGTNPTERTLLYVEAATIQKSRLDDAGQAIELFARVLELDPGHQAAMQGLCELAWERKEFDRALPLLEHMALDEAARSTEDRARLHQRAAEAAIEVGDRQRAALHGRQALALDPRARSFARDFADRLYDKAWWAESAEAYEDLLAHADAGLSAAGRLELTARLGRALTGAGRPQEASVMLSAALERAGEHRELREAAVEASVAAGDPRMALQHQQALLAGVPPGDARFGLLVAMGRRCRDELQDPATAAQALARALDLRPDDRAVTHELLDLYTALKQWKSAVTLLRRLADGGTGEVRAKYLVAAANILHYELHGTDEAVEIYEKVLDEDPADLKTFERVDKILTAKRAWRDEARAYRRMIKRLGAASSPAHKATLLMLWRGLGEIYRTRLGDLQAAAAAFEVAVQLASPEDGVDLEILAEILEAGGADTWAKAVEIRSVLTQRASDSDDLIKQLRALRRLYQTAGRWDRVFCVCAALVSLDRAEPKEREFFDRLANAPLPAPRAGLTEEMWRKLVMHPEEELRLSVLIGALAPVAAFVRAAEPKKFGLKERNRLNLDADPSTLARLCATGSAVLGVARPAVYALPEVRGEIDLANVKEGGHLHPTLVVGSDTLGRQNLRELAFIVGRRLAWLRPEHMVLSPYVVSSREELKLMVLAALKLFQPSATFPEEVEPAFQQYVTLFQRGLPPQNLEALGTVVPALLGAGARLDLDAWRRGAERSAARAGLLLCGDVSVAARLLHQGGGDDANPAAVDLIKWSVSPSYLMLREQLGLGAVGPGFQVRETPAVPRVVQR